MSQPRYAEIAGEIRTAIDAGGQLLASEADLSKEHGVSRITIRRALDSLREEGLVDSRQGFGWFVVAEPVKQSLATLGTIEEQLGAQGRASERRVLDFQFVEPPHEIGQIMGVDKTLRARRLNLADGRPFARVTIWCPDDMGHEISRADVERTSFLDLLDVGPCSASQTIAAAAASPGDAGL